MSQNEYLVSPFSGKNSVLSEHDDVVNDLLMICFDTGYHTYKNLWKVGSEYIDRVEKTLPLHVINSKKTTPDGNVWYRLIQINPFYVLLPEIENDKFVWSIYGLVPIKDETEPVVSTLPVDNGESGKHIGLTFDTSTKITFADGDFEKAYDEFFKLYYQTVNTLSNDIKN